MTDFGVAHIDDDAPLTVMGDMLGTIEYASPEQVHGNETPDARSDVYSLAAVAYFALTGTPPFRAADNSTQAQLSVMHRQVFAEPPPLRFHREDLSPEIEAVVLRGLAKAPEARYPSAGQFAAALRSAVKRSIRPSSARWQRYAPDRRACRRAGRDRSAFAGRLRIVASQASRIAARSYSAEAEARLRRLCPSAVSAEPLPAPPDAAGQACAASKPAPAKAGGCGHETAGLPAKPARANQAALRVPAEARCR